MEPVEISAGRLHLRPWQPYDAEVVLAACSDPEVQRWTSVPVPYTLEHARTYVEGDLDRWSTGRELGWAVCDSTSGRVLASICVRPGHDSRTWDVGCWAAPWGRGQGVVPEAVAAVARWAFATLDAQRVEWLADPRNWSSRRAAHKAGFTAEGVLRGRLEHRGQTQDGWVASLRPGDPERDTAVLPRLPPLTAGDLVLRTWRPADATAVEAALADGLGVPGLERQQGKPPAEVARWWVEEQAPGREAAGQGLAVSVWAGDVLVGSLQVFLAGRRDGICEVGVWVAPSARRQGVATRSVGALLEWAAPVLGLVRAEWVAAAGNEASTALAVRLGFVHEGTARSALRDDAWQPCDAVVLARTWPPPARCDVGAPGEGPA